jgi:hypothetical protein
MKIPTSRCLLVVYETVQRAIENQIILPRCHWVQTQIIQVKQCISSDMASFYEVMQ